MKSIELDHISATVKKGKEVIRGRGRWGWVGVDNRNRLTLHMYVHVRDDW